MNSKLLLSLLLSALVACAHSTRLGAPGPADYASRNRVELGTDLYVEPIADGVWRHVSFKEVAPWGNVLSAGLLVEAPRGLVLLDTPWTVDQAERLIAWGRTSRGQAIHEVIITHAHLDRYGGAPALAASGATLRSLQATIDLLRKKGLELAFQPVGPNERLVLAGEPIDIFFPGAAHAPDNTVVWLPRHGVLLGGCMIRAAPDRSLGNLEDADPVSWRDAIRRVIARFPETRIVIPSHGDPGGPELLLHTRDLADAADNK